MSDKLFKNDKNYILKKVQSNKKNSNKLSYIKIYREV